MAQKKVIMRLDWDEYKGAHINVTDFRLGKGTRGVAIAIPFKGDLKKVLSLLRSFNR